ncbi:hypothetical protein [Roseivivax sediminis]|uniref:Porin n=1 Tax=Roseivivax sediminis TaxID=936889 RepID=A0A1I2EN05_9RHOB|nr:hypothetical protein [Roseivivax sediminis]SFE93741.1 hypothetical protein SAMN04515678_1266 [Roseivivax sediminis]
MTRTTRSALAVAIVFSSSATLTHADGSFLQVDLTPETANAVGAVARGPLNFGLSFNDYEGGSVAGASLTYALPLGEIATLKLGPALAAVRDDDDGFEGIEGGAKVVLDRYTPTSFGGLYLLAEANTIQSSWFALAQTSFGNSGFSAELSRGGSDTYDEATLAINKRIGNGPVSLRAGWRLISEQAFVGVSINTF